ncbi:MAG TPA: hypothetical protein VIB48_22845 [Acidimicrobiia bacterium]
MRTLARATVRAVFVAVATVATLVVSAAPAWAHGVSGVQPTNYRTTVSGVTPPVDGITVRAVDLGGKLQLTNRSGTDVVVLGYQNEPYLRVGPRGVFENTRSPAVFLNRTTVPSAAAPKRYDASAPPVWHKVSDAQTVRWHDHRAHWMGAAAPPEVSRDPSARHVVISNWNVPARYGNRAVAFTGDVVWIPGPSPWPWLGGALAIAAVVVLAARTRSWPLVLAVATALLVAGEAVHIAGLWGATTANTVSKLGASVYSIAGCLVGIGALAMLRRRDPYDATPVVLVAAVFLLIAGGFADITSITRSQLPSTLPEALARGVVMTALGLGTGLVVAAAMRLRRPAGPQRRATGARPRPAAVRKRDAGDSTSATGVH